MTVEEWATAYVLQFGMHQIYMSDFEVGEVEFFDQAAVDLGFSDSLDAIVEIRAVIIISSGEEPP